MCCRCLFCMTSRPVELSAMSQQILFACLLQSVRYAFSSLPRYGCSCHCYVMTSPLPCLFSPGPPLLNPFQGPGCHWFIQGLPQPEATGANHLFLAEGVRKCTAVTLLCHSFNTPYPMSCTANPSCAVIEPLLTRR